MLPRLKCVAVFAACVLLPGCTETHRPSTPEARAGFIALARSLESDPLAERAPAIRQQLHDWVMEVPDIRFRAQPLPQAGAGSASGF